MNIETLETQTETIPQMDTAPEVQTTPKETETVSAAPKESDKVPTQTIAEKIQAKTIVRKKSPAASGETVKEEAPAYTPNFKFKSYGKEYEIDEMFRGLIKDPETEKKVKSFFERAYGVDVMKSTNQKVKEEFNAFKEQVAQRDKALDTLSSYIQNDDLHSFFQALKIPEEKVLRYALDRVQYRELSPEQRAQVDAQHSERHRAMTLEEQNQMLAQQYQAEAARARGLELDYELNAQEVKAAAEAFDARVGQPGAFKQEVIRRGQYLWHTEQRDIPARQAIQEVIANYGLNSQQNSFGQAIPASAGASQAPVTPTQQIKPTLPNIRGSGTSPVQRVPKTLEDLKKIAAQKLSQQ
jgi:hypothetical protein